MGPQAGETKKLVLKSKYGPIYIYILIELASRNVILKYLMLKMKTLITLK